MLNYIEIMNRLLKNFSYTFLSNILSLAISALVTFLVPKNLGVENYGYFQLYVFYVNYIGFLHFGWADGIYLRYGGEYYEKLNKSVFCGQFLIYSFLEFTIGIIVLIIGNKVVDEPNKSIIISMIAVAIVFVLPRTLLQYILQGTNRIKEYALVTITERLVYFAIVIVMLFLKNSHHLPIILADLCGKNCALIMGIYFCRDIFKTFPASLSDSVIEAWKNIKVGSKLVVANMASMLIIGVVRMAIENAWDVKTFGKVSLTMSVSNMLVLFIGAVAQVMFPLLRRTEQEHLSNIYSIIRSGLMIPLFAILIFYYPIKFILSIWLPKYADSLSYMALLFPMCIFETKMRVLVETYMKTMRKEKWLLWVNLITLGLSILMTYITVFRMHNLDLTVAIIVILLAFRSIFSEIMLSRILDIKIKWETIKEISLTLCFMISSWFIGGILGMVIYFIAYIIYLGLHKNELNEIIHKLIFYKPNKQK